MPQPIPPQERNLADPQPDQHRHRPTSSRLQLHAHRVRAQVFDDHTPTNTPAARSIGAIALDPTGNVQGAYNFLSLATGARISRHRWTELPIPDTTAIGGVEALALRDKMSLLHESGLVVVEWRHDQAIDDDAHDFDYAPPKRPTPIPILSPSPTMMPSTPPNLTILRRLLSMSHPLSRMRSKERSQTTSLTQRTTMTTTSTTTTPTVSTMQSTHTLIRTTPTSKPTSMTTRPRTRTFSTMRNQKLTTKSTMKTKERPNRRRATRITKERLITGETKKRKESTVESTTCATEQPQAPGGSATLSTNPAAPAKSYYPPVETLQARQFHQVPKMKGFASKNDE